MGTVSAGAACAATTGNGCFQMHVPAIPDGPAFGYGAVGMFTAAFVAFDRSVRLGKGADGFKFMVAVFADIFVNRHSILVISGQWSVVKRLSLGLGYMVILARDLIPFFCF